MIRLFVFSLLTIAAALWMTLYLGFPADPGYLLLAFGDYTFETSLLALLAAAGLAYLLLRLALAAARWLNPRRLVTFGRDRGRRRARSHALEGLLSYARGDWRASYGHLTRGEKDGDASVVNRLAAACAAHRMGGRELWMRELEAAEREHPAARSTVNAVKARLLFRSGQLEQCLALLEKMKDTSLNDAAMLGLLKDVYERLEDWERLEALLPALEKSGAAGADELGRLRVRLFMRRLREPRGGAGGEGAGSADEIKRLWKAAAAEVREDGRAALRYAELLAELGDGDAAARAVEAALSKRWDETLVRRYGEMDLGGPAARLAAVEKWLRDRPDDAALNLCAGRVCLRNRLWGRAREHFEASVGAAPTTEAYGELARLLERLGDGAAAASCLREHAGLLGAGLPALPMPRTGGDADRPDGPAGGREP